MTVVSVALSVALTMAATCAALPVRAEEVDDSPEVVLLLFHGEGCPHCAAERQFLDQLAVAHPALRIEQYEVWHDTGNRDLLEAYGRELGFEPSGVPVTILGERVWIGFSESIAAQIEAAVAADLAAASRSPTPGASASPDSSQGTHSAGSVDLPLVGAVSLAGTSLVLATLLIGFADGINPCSLWVLAVLLAIVLHSKSRGWVALVGATFLAATATMYGLYVAGMYSALDYASGMGWIRVVVAAVALAFGILQLKDGIRPGVGPSLSISPGRRPRIFAAMRRVARPERGVLPTLAGTVVLAVGVSLLETPCTAGLPMLWTSILAEQHVALGTAIGLFALYMAVFLIDELAVFAAAVVTMRAHRLQPDEGRLLKIISGSLLSTLGITMLIAPEAMSGLASSVLVFLAAAALALTTWVATRTRARNPTWPKHP